MADAETLRSKIEILLEHSADRLSAWEVDFLEDLQQWEGELRERQVEKLEEIWADKKP